jgi:hypothetical protein
VFQECLVVEIYRAAYDVRHDGCPSGNVSRLCVGVDLDKILDDL